MKEMIGVYKLGEGLVAVTESYEKACEVLFNEFADETEKKIYKPTEWFERNKADNNGAPRCYNFYEIPVW